MWQSELFYKLAIFSLNDLIEIFFFTSLIYYFSIWLQQDRQKPLLAYFYSACSLIILINLLELNTLTSGMYLLLPTTLMLFILVHQKSLQQNFVSLKNIQPAQVINHNWIDTLLRACIIAANNQKMIYCLIEGKNSLAELINSNLMVQAKLQPELLDALIGSPHYDAKKMIWLSNTGVLIALNSEIIINQKQLSEVHNWQDHASWFTKQTDSLIFRLNSQTKNFDIVASGQAIENISMDHAIKLMRKHFTNHKGNHDYQIAKKIESQIYN